MIDANSVMTGNKGIDVVVPVHVNRGEKTAEQVKPAATVADTANEAMGEKSLQARQQSKEVVSLKEANRRAKEIQSKLDKMGSNLQFVVDEDTESIVYKFTSKESGEVVRQIPSEEILELRSKLDDLLGLIFDQKV